MLRILPPWHENLKKRQVKSPKIYIRDSGICHSLLQLTTLADLQGHPKIGASWEGFALEHVLQAFRTRDAYFWATHAGAELDLVLFFENERIGFEFKYADAPDITRSMRIATNDLGLSHLYVVYPGREAYPLDDGISVLPFDDISELSRQSTAP